VFVSRVKLFVILEESVFVVQVRGISHLQALEGGPALLLSP
jgi:hypothetical protein